MATMDGWQRDQMTAELARLLCLVPADEEPCENCQRAALLVVVHRGAVADFLRKWRP